MRIHRSHPGKHHPGARQQHSLSQDEERLTEVLLCGQGRVSVPRASRAWGGMSQDHSNPDVCRRAGSTGEAPEQKQSWIARFPPKQLSDVVSGKGRKRMALHHLLCAGASFSPLAVKENLD